jgi:hypothetical protein
MKSIELTKQLFVLDIEEGNEVWIPKSLSVDGYPKSFQYYDPIQHFIWDAISEQKKENF